MNHYMTREIYPEYIKLNNINNRQITQLKYGQRIYLHRHFSEENLQITNRHMKRY